MAREPLDRNDRSEATAGALVSIGSIAERVAPASKSSGSTSMIRRTGFETPLRNQLKPISSLLNRCSCSQLVPVLWYPMWTRMGLTADQAPRGSPAIVSCSASTNGSRPPSGSGCQAHVGEEARHRHALAEVAEPRLGPLAAGERERELRVAAPGRQRQREAAAEARVDVGDLEAAVGDAEALDVRRPPDRQRLRDEPSELDQLRDP